MKAQAAPALVAVGPVLDLLRELVGEVRGLRADLTRHRPVSALSREDRAILARLLPALGGALGSEPFTSRDLACHSAPGLRLVLRTLSAKSIGRLLARAVGVPIDGWIVQRCGTEINVTLWRVVASVSHRLETGTAIAQSDSIGRGECDV